MNSPIEVRLALAILLIGHVIAAWTSFGFHQPDEHFQILEWANHFLRLNPDATLMKWEHAARIRPWFQPMLHAAFMKPFLALGIYNPFTNALLCRILYGLLNVLALRELWRFFSKRYSLDPVLFLWISMLWFLPYLHVRTSSENLSSLFLSFAMIPLLQGTSPVRAGMLLGFSFIARYQIALGIAGIGLGLIWRDRRITRDHLLLGLGFLLPVALGTLLDRIGYGQWVFTPWLYFKVNILDGVAAQFNPRPWWMYFSWVLQLNPLTSLPLFLGAVLFMRRARREDRLLAGGFVWSFFLLHCAIRNKEYRFLFPVINLSLFLAAVAFRNLAERLRCPRGVYAWACMNGLFFLISTWHGASLLDTGAVEIAGRNLDPSRPVLAQSDYQKRMPYYRFPEHDSKPLIHLEQLKQELGSRRSLQVLLDGRFEDPNMRKMDQTLLDSGCLRKDTVYPMWTYLSYEKFPLIGSHPYIAWYDCP